MDSVKDVSMVFIFGQEIVLREIHINLTLSVKHSLMVCAYNAMEETSRLEKRIFVSQ